jgi:outer membrane protein
MKKITLILTLCILCITSTFAQKYGHVNSYDVMMAMPGIDSIQIKLVDFQQNLATLYENMVAEFQAKKDKLDKEAGTMSSAVRKLKEDELMSLQNRIIDFQNNVQQDIEEQEATLVAPFQEKVKNAIDEVAKEHKYAYIFDTRMLLYFDGGDDVTALVKKKLGIK